MRDPLGTIYKSKHEVVRKLNQPIESSAFLHQDEAHELVKQKLLIKYVFKNELEVVSPLMPFVSYPHEWCDAQLYSAADLTLKIAEYCEQSNWELKDASSWNIIFDGTEPIFCDHLSFQKITKKNWWAFAQYIRNFIFPLYGSKFAGLNAYETFKLNRDGLEPSKVKSMLRSRRFFTRLWPLLINIKGSTTNLVTKTDVTEVSRHKNLFSLLRYCLNGCKPDNKLSIWSKYVDSRDHYSDTSQEEKNHKIEKWLKETQPKWVTDFGCNIGQYSQIANKIGSKVIAIDFDHESIQQLFLSEKGNRNIYPIVADLDDIFAGRGWAGEEFEGLMPRVARVNDMTLMLALIHHIAISKSIPYTRIAQFARSVTKKWLIVEFLGQDDPLVKHLCAQRDRIPQDFTLNHQVEAFEKYFNTLETHNIVCTHRQLRLLEVRK